MTDRHWTPREIEVVRLTTEGLTAQQIARRLTLAPKTVENHIWRAKQKADCPNRAALVRYAITRGLVDPPPVADAELEDAGLDLLIRHLDTGGVVDCLDTDEVIDVREEDEEEDEAPAARPRRGIVVAVLVLLTLTGVTVYSIIMQAPSPPAAATAPATTTVTVVTSVTAPPTTRHKVTTATPTRRTG